MHAAQAHIAQEQYGAAIGLLREAYGLAPGQPHTLVTLSIALRDNGQLGEALEAADQAIALDTTLAVAHFNRAHALEHMNRTIEALEAFDAAVAQKPGFVMAHVAKGQLLAKLGRREDALACCQRAAALQAGHRETQMIHGETLLQLGDYLRGWELFEARRQRASRVPDLLGAIAPWLGESVADKKVLIRPEIGLGDFVMFARYVPLLEERGAEVLLLAPPPLAGLLAHSFPRARIVTGKHGPVNADFHCPVMSLPHVFRTTVDTVPAIIPYLRVPGTTRAQWQDRLGPRSRPRIGVMWSRGRPRRIDQSPLSNRSLPLEALRAWSGLPLEFHSLQKEVLPLDAKGLGQMGFIRDHHESLKDFCDTAALIEEMDVVVSIDTSVAHVAGALGKPLWMMLPFASDYRWPIDGTASPWYPAARLFRQPTPGDWAPVVSGVADELATL